MTHYPNPDGQPFMLYCEVEIWCNCGEENTYLIDEGSQVVRCRGCQREFHLTGAVFVLLDQEKLE